MINSSVTIYHKYLDQETKLEKWQRHILKNAWWFSGKGATVNNGYENANNVDARIWYKTNANLNVGNIKIGDIIVKGAVELDINTQQDLKEYEFYNIVSIKDNNFGNNPHVHIGGK